MSKNFDQERFNPCLKEQNMTYKCFSDHNYDKEKCALFMENYKNCKSFWGAVKADRRKNGVVPHLPEAHEREKIKEEYMKTKPVQ